MTPKAAGRVRWGLILAVSLCWAPGELRADGVGSPAGILKKGQWSFGADGGTLLERDIEDGTNTGQATAIQVGHSRGYGLTDSLSAYVKIGAARLKVKDSSVTISGSNEHSFGGALLISGQLRGRFWRQAERDVEWDGSVGLTHIRSRHDGKSQGDWNEWQFATSVAKGFGGFTPYAGLKLSFIDFDYTLRSDQEVVAAGTYAPDGVVGTFIGADFTMGPSENVVMNIEASYLDGAAVDLALTYTF